MKKLIFHMLCIAVLYLFVSCSKQSDTSDIPEIPEIPETPVIPDTPENSEIKEVKVSIRGLDFEQEDASRTSYSFGTAKYEAKWADGDIIGIYPEGGSQVAFPISNGIGGNVAVFKGDKWPLKATVGYAAYYPFNKDNYVVSSSKIPVTYAGQVQNGNESVTHVSSFDYLASKPAKPNSDGTVIIDMEHMGCIFFLKLTMPKAGTYTQVSLISDNKEFTVQGTLDLTKEVPDITPTSTSKMISISLKEVTLTSDNELLAVNLIVAPKDLSGSNITITVTDSNGETYSTDSDSIITGKEYVADKAYVYNRTMLIPPEPESEEGTGAELEPGGGIEEG